MSDSVECRLAGELAESIRAGRKALVARWVERIAARVALDPNRVFPTHELLDHVPLLMDGIADYLENPADEISADIPVLGKAVELGELRHAQGFDAHQILKEYEILGGILFDHLAEVASGLSEPCGADELLVCAHRVFRALAVIQQVTTGHFLRLADERVKEREDRLRGFNRSLSHEMKNRIGAVRGANDLLREPGIGADPASRERFTGIIARNAEGMREMLESLLELSRMESGVTPPRNVLLPDAAGEVARQLREFAEARGVDLRLAGDLPPVEVPAAVVELCLTNYLSNAVKYRDPTSPEPWVRVEGEVRTGTAAAGCEVVVRVRDNGLGVPPEAREKLFQRFFRAHEGTVTGEEGTGLGLAIVRETVESVDGRAWAEFDGGGSVFAFAVPCADGGGAPADPPAPPP